MPRKARRRQPATAPGLFWRGDTAHWRGQLPQSVGGDRITKTLDTQDEALAVQRAAAAQTFLERGDWTVLRRWKAGDLHIGDMAHAIREGDYARLRRLSADGPVLGPEADRFLERTAATLARKTTETYTAAVGLLLADFGRDYPMHQLTVRDAEAFLHAAKETTGGRVWSARSQGNARTIYGALWDAARQHETEEAEKRGAVPLLSRNPWKKAKIPEQRQTRREYLTPDEWRTLIEHREVRDTPTACLLACATLAGLREDEILHLRPDLDVDLEAGVLRVQSRDGEFAWKTKHEHSERDVPVVPALAGIIERHVERGFSGKRYLIRAWRRDQPIGATTADGWTRRAFEAAGIKYGRKKDALTLHSLRHTFGTWLALDRVPVHVGASLMGNTPEVFLNTYAHHSRKDRIEAMQTIKEASE
jgi:integrase